MASSLIFLSLCSQIVSLVFGRLPHDETADPVGSLGAVCQWDIRRPQTRGINLYGCLRVQLLLVLRVLLLPSDLILLIYYCIYVLKLLPSSLLRTTTTFATEKNRAEGVTMKLVLLLRLLSLVLRRLIVHLHPFLPPATMTNTQ